jgi:hypothetical protein
MAVLVHSPHRLYTGLLGLSEEKFGGREEDQAAPQCFRELGEELRLAIYLHEH